MTFPSSHSFYVTLLSQDDKDQFPANQPHRFKNRLPRPIRFVGSDWQVGLVSLSIPDVPAVGESFIQSLTQADLLLTGQEFLKNLVRRYDQERAKQVEVRTKLAEDDGTKLYPTFEWTRDGDLVLKTEKVDEYYHVDLNRSYFTMHLRLKKSDGSNIAAVNKLWVTNNLAHTIIKQIDLRLNGTLISPQSDTYHYKAYLETLMNYVREEGETVLRPQGWFNALDFPPEWTANNTDSATPHNDYRDLPANHKAALALSKAETALWGERVAVWCFNLTWKPFTQEASWCLAWKSR